MAVKPQKRRCWTNATIRAAADPITRELYIARAAERTNVAKAVLDQEVGRLEARGAVRAAAEPVSGGPGSGSAEARPAPHVVENSVAPNRLRS